jgi:hypothetical protein
MLVLCAKAFFPNLEGRLFTWELYKYKWESYKFRIYADSIFRKTKVRVLRTL